MIIGSLRSGQKIPTLTCLPSIFDIVFHSRQAVRIGGILGQYRYIVSPTEIEKMVSIAASVDSALLLLSDAAIISSNGAVNKFGTFAGNGQASKWHQPRAIISTQILDYSWVQDDKTLFWQK